MVLTLDQEITLWSLETKTIVQNIRYNEIPTCIQFHPVEDMIFASGSLDKVLRVTEIINKNIIDCTYVSNSLGVQTHDHITSICFSNSGKHIIVGFSHGVCRIYQSVAKF